MAVLGDLKSFPLPELLQWIDGSRKSGELQLSWEGGNRRMFINKGEVTAVASPGLHERLSRMVALSALASGEEVLASLRAATQGETKGEGIEAAQALAREDLMAGIAFLTTWESGRFHWSEDEDRGNEEWVELKPPFAMRELLFDALRWVDEQKSVEHVLKSDLMTVTAKAEPNHALPVIQQVVLALSQGGVSLAHLRLQMGASRAAVSRWVFDLLKAERVEVEGAEQPEEDPLTKMLEQGSQLVRQQQFDAAALVFQALLASDPSDRRVQEFARMVERDHSAHLYQELSPMSVPKMSATPQWEAVRPEDRPVAQLINNQWDISTIVLASNKREIETLRSLARLLRAGIIELS